MISTSATSTNHCSYHWPSIHRLCAVPDERAGLFFLIYILNCSAGNKSRVSGKLFAKWKKKKKQGTCRGKCFPVLAELAVGKSSTHKVSLSRTFSLIRIPGRGAAGSRAHLLEIFRYFTVFFSFWQRVELAQHVGILSAVAQHAAVRHVWVAHGADSI